MMTRFKKCTRAGYFRKKIFKIFHLKIKYKLSNPKFKNKCDPKLNAKQIHKFQC